MRNYTALCLPVLLLILAGVGHGQESLGDVARAQRQKQQAKDSKAAPRVVTNEEIPESSDAGTNTSSDAGAPPDSSEPASPTGKKTAEQWKAEIQAKKSRVSAMQSNLDKLNDSVHFVEANRYSNGVQYNQYQLKKQQEAQRMQKQLDGEKKQLAEMQESARKAGYGTAVYDPGN